MNFKLYLENSGAKRIYFSKQKIEKFNDININSMDNCQKPKGVWYSCNNSWEKWFKDEYNDAANFINDPNYKYLIEIDSSKIIRLKSIEDIKSFNEKYGIEQKKMANPRTGSGMALLPYDNEIFERRFNKFKKGEEEYYGWWNVAKYEMKKGKSEEEIKKYLITYEYCMDWTKVAQEYNGIEICPYFEQNNLNILKEGYSTYLRWYNRWDVASGCIWKPSTTILDFKLLKGGWKKD